MIDETKVRAALAALGKEIDFEPAAGFDEGYAAGVTHAVDKVEEAMR